MTRTFKSPVYAVGLTGGIASGKSAVSRRFGKFGIEIIDTDLIARQIVGPGEEALSEIVAAFGPQVLDEKGALRRRELRRIIFREPNKRSVLESILHPRIAAEVQRQLEQVASAYCIVVIPLLAESGRYKWLDRIVVVDVPEKVQIGRLIKRDGVTHEEAQASLASQASRQARLDIADDIIDNSGAESELDGVVGELHERYLKLAEGRETPSREC